MRRIRTLCLWLCTTACANAQTEASLTPSPYTFRLGHFLLKDGTTKVGWFLGTHRDTVVIQIASKTERISRFDLLRVTIERERQHSPAVLAGALSAMYLGCALALTSQEYTSPYGEPPFLFLTEGETTSLVLLNALFAAIGGGVGYLIAHGQDPVSVFDFAGNPEKAAAAWAALVEADETRGRAGSIHASVQASWVRGPLPAPGSGAYYGMYDATRFNMMRKLQLTYSVSEFLELGLASLWLGQPPVTSYSTGAYYTPTATTLTMEGNGFYVVAAFQPLWKLGWRSVQWDIGGGVGKASVELAASEAPYFTGPPTSRVGTTAAGFSAMAYTEIKIFIAPYFTLGVAADVVYVPEDVPDIPGVTFETGTLSTTSVGLVLGIHL